MSGDAALSDQIPYYSPLGRGITFAHLCNLGITIQQILVAYRNLEESSRTDQVPLSFAESKYQQLLAWSDTLSDNMERNDQPSAYLLYYQ